ncbi:transglycosylase domain-containing protein [Aquirufa rosea]|uniref:Penicillin-binding protein n=1 Tax=Aquirufa rosea TaxID=2509241 RepID=A0A4Q1BXX9_9BACT|nr:transglycosylase domain-containing protein [Aquirufa rosea]RXK47533.1 penicillin-binding protein [Aquirufa rosea]
MLQRIRMTVQQIKGQIWEGLERLSTFLLALIARLLGEKKYSWLVGQIAMTSFFLRTKWRLIEAFYEERVDKNSLYYKPIVTMWKVAAKVLLYVLIYLFVIETNIFWLTGEMPGVDELQNPKLSQASEIYSADGVLLGKYFAENRTPIRDYKLISPYLVQALVATEDARFYEHTGIDFQAWIGVAVGLVKGGDRGGGSTISQQLAKNLFKTRTKKGFTKTGILGYIPGLNKLIYKSKEWVTAIKLERFYTKDEIILWYLNTVDYGNNAYGIKVASKTYFNTSPDSLNIQEAAILVGLQKATTTYNPKRYEGKPLEENKAWKRRNVVLSQMVKAGYLKKTAYDSLAKLPIELHTNEESPYDGTGNYFKVAIAKYLTEWAKANDMEIDLYRDGLKIYTTIDSRMQIHAEQAVEAGMRSIQKTFDNHWAGQNPWVDEHGKEIPGFIDTVAKRTEYYKALVHKYPNNPDSVMHYMKNVKRKMWVYSRTSLGEEQMTMSAYDSIQYYKRFLQSGMMTLDPYTGHIKAWVGGLDFKYFKYDHVKQSKRQPGSTFKPFVYTAAIDGPRDLSPCYMMTDEPFELEVEENGEKKIWRPSNADGTFSYSTMPLRRALAKSINSITARLTNEVGADTVMYYAQKMGIKSPLKAVPSIGLGSFDVSLYEMIGAYSAFVNEGIHVEPMIVQEIKDQNGKVLQHFDPVSYRVIKKESAQLVRSMLEGVVYEGGTGSSLLWNEGEVLLPANNRYAPAFAAKTGTTSNHSDGWFIGMTHNLISGVWVGGDDRSIHFRTGALGEGSKTALPIYKRFMIKVVNDPLLANYKPVPFDKLDKRVVKKDFNCQSSYSSLPDSLQVSDSELDSLNSLLGNPSEPSDTSQHSPQ